MLIRDKRKGLIVTDVGNRILVHIREILNGVEKIEQEVGWRKGMKLERFELGVFRVLRIFLPKMINIFP